MTCIVNVLLWWANSLGLDAVPALAHHRSQSMRPAIGIIWPQNSARFREKPWKWGVRDWLLVYLTPFERVVVICCNHNIKNVLNHQPNNFWHLLATFGSGCGTAQEMPRFRRDFVHALTCCWPLGKNARTPEPNQRSSWRKIGVKARKGSAVTLLHGWTTDIYSRLWMKIIFRLEEFSIAAIGRQMIWGHHGMRHVVRLTLKLASSWLLVSYNRFCSSTTEFPRHQAQQFEDCHTMTRTADQSSYMFRSCA